MPPVSPAEIVAQRNSSFDQARSNLYTTVGTTSDTVSHETIEALPQGANAPVEKVLLQAPGVSQDSAASGLIHVRNDHANVQFRINGVMLPDGVTGFGSIFDTNFIGSASLVVGALPAEFGLRTVGLVDLTTRQDIFNNSGSINYYFGSRETIQPSFEYGGTFGANCPSASTAVPTKAPASASSTCFGGVQYYFTGSYLQTNEGIENSTPFLNPVHDFSQQERGFAYLSTFLDPYTRLSLIAGSFNASFQIPNVFNAPLFPGLRPRCSELATFNSSKLNERQNEQIPIWRAGAATFDQRLRRANLVFHALQQPAFHSRPSRRPPSQRHCLGHQPAILYQRRSKATRPTSSIRRIRCAPVSP